MHGVDFVLLTAQDDSLSCQEARKLPKALRQLLFSPSPDLWRSPGNL